MLIFWRIMSLRNVSLSSSPCFFWDVYSTKNCSNYQRDILKKFFFRIAVRILKDNIIFSRHFDVLNEFNKAIFSTHTHFLQNVYNEHESWSDLLYGANFMTSFKVVIS